MCDSATRSAQIVLFGLAAMAGAGVCSTSVRAECEAPAVCIEVELPEEKPIIVGGEGTRLKRLLKLPGRKVDYKLVPAEHPPDFVTILLYWVDSNGRRQFVGDTGCDVFKSDQQSGDFEAVLDKKTHRKKGRLLLVAMPSSGATCPDELTTDFSKIEVDLHEDQQEELLVKWTRQ